ncbi:MAG TPA: circadian clock KaiB family protein [Polyangiaceae bacterium]|nr:circadian clock KaiB family protein [Polyangiaceae bacterium]
MTKLRPSTAAFETAVERVGEERYELRLYIAGTTKASSKSVENLRAICEEHLKGRYELMVIDVFQQPVLAKDEQIIAVPTLIKKLPAPIRRIVGDLSNEHRVLVGLDLKSKEHGQARAPSRSG